MDFDSAKSAFVNLICTLECEDRSKFLSWCRDYKDNDQDDTKNYFKMRTIAEDIKTLVPLEAIFPSEQINHVHDYVNNESGEMNAPIIHVDSFLFEDDHVDDLVEDGKLSKNFCADCGSRNIAPITFITHSASVKRIEFIFQYMLPDLSDKVVLDVGSRLGAILYGAYYYSTARKIIGVEMNPDLCELQKHMIHKYNLKDRIEVICDNVCNIPSVVQTANIIIFNNVFEYFMPKKIQEEIWKWLRRTITNSGTILVTTPSIEKTLSSLEIEIDISTWLRRFLITDPEVILKNDDEDLLSETCSYVVI